MRKAVVRLLFGFFSGLCSYPIVLKWSEKDALISPTSGVKLKLWYLNQLITMIQIPIFVHALYYKWEEYVTQNLYFRLVFHCLWIVLCTLCCTLQWIFFNTSDQVISLVNQTVMLQTHLENRVFSHGTYDRGMKWRFLVLSVYAALYVCDISFVLMPLFLSCHRESWFLSAYFLYPLYENERLHNLALALAFAFEFWWESVQFAGLGLQIYIHLLYLQTMTASLKNLRIMAARIPPAHDAQIKRVLSCYMKLRVLSTMYNRSMGESFLPYFKTTLGLSAAGTMISFVKLLTIGNVFMIMFTLICLLNVAGTLTTVTKLCARLHELSVNVYSTLLPTKCPKKITQKELQSYKILGVEVGSFYSIHRVTPLTLLAMVSSLTMNLLISIKFQS